MGTEYFVICEDCQEIKELNKVRVPRSIGSWQEFVEHEFRDCLHSPMSTPELPDLHRGQVNIAALIELMSFLGDEHAGHRCAVISDSKLVFSGAYDGLSEKHLTRMREDRMRNQVAKDTPDSDTLVCGGGLVRDITVCHLPYQAAPFVHGWIETANGPRDVWLRNDGLWTSEECDERNSLILSDAWNPPKNE